MSRINCIKNNSYTNDGMLIEGHTYIAKVVITDIDTNRSYTLDECEQCGKYSASFLETNGSLAEQLIPRYPFELKVGEQK